MKHTFVRKLEVPLITSMPRSVTNAKIGWLCCLRGVAW